MQMFNAGNCAVELTYWFATSVSNGGRDADMRLLRAYHAELELALQRRADVGAAGAGGEKSGAAVPTLAYPFEQLWKDWATCTLDFAMAIMVRKFKVDRPAAVARREEKMELYKKKRKALDGLDVRVITRCLWIYEHHRAEFF